MEGRCRRMVEIVIKGGVIVKVSRIRYKKERGIKLYSDIVNVG